MIRVKEKAVFRYPQVGASIRCGGKKLTPAIGRITILPDMSASSKPASWLIPFGLLVFAIVAVPLHILDEQGLPRFRALKNELGEVRRQNEELERQVRDLQRQVRTLAHDPAAVEQIARDELGMIRDGEIVFQFAE